MNLLSLLRVQLGGRAAIEAVRVDRLLGEHGIQQDSPAERQEFERQMEQRRLEEGDEEARKQIREGWCLGSEAFRRKCREQMEGQLGDNHPGQARLVRAEVKAERLVREQLQLLGWTEADLAARRRSDPSKLAIAARLRAETTLSLKPIAERLNLGKPKGAKTNLHKWINGQGNNDTQATLEI